ncbi:MAG: ROK family protein [Chitinivibrionales bacterium]|nr:ROK family protein [Chitinivibrionales bacterium]
MPTSAIGIDLGGTNLKACIMNKTGEFRHLRRRPTQAQKGGPAVLDTIMRMIETVLADEGGSGGILGVGIGSPGFVDEDGTVLGGAQNLPGWEGMQIFEPIKSKFGLNVTAGNDVTVTALAESCFGAAKEVKNSVTLALGTGIGAGIVVNGKVYKGTHGMAGEMGHVIVETNGRQCTCGLKGCVEQYASGTGIVNVAREMCTSFTPQKPSTLARIALENPSGITAKLVYEHAEADDPYALYINDYICHKLSIAIGTILNSLAPDRIILGGGIMKSHELIIATVNKYTPRYCWNSIWERCDIVPAKAGENAGVLGAAALVFEEMEG